MAPAALLLLSSSLFGQRIVDGPLVIFVGPPVSGKTTQAREAAKTLNVPIISLEDLRAARPNDINRAFADRIQKKDTQFGVILDGYPSTKDQADFIANWIEQGKLLKPVIIHLQVPDDVARKRGAVQERDVEEGLAQYHREYELVKAAYPNAEFQNLDGTKSRASIAGEVRKILSARLSTVTATPVAQGPLVEGPAVLLIGPPASGKSTQAKSIAQKFGLPIVAVDDLIRDNPQAFEAARRSKISGMEPQSDPVLNKLFEARLAKGDLVKGFLLDGYPSTKDHADFVAALVRQGKIPNPIVVQLNVPDDILKKRMAGDPGARPESFEQRLKDYHREMDLIQLYFPKADLVPIDGTKKPDQVTKEIEKLLEPKLKKK